MARPLQLRGHRKDIMTSPAKILVAGLTTFLVVGSWTDASAGAGLQCKEMRKGDIDACKATVKKKCTQEKYWDRRRCENDVVVSSDACYTPAFEKSCKVASETYNNLCSKSGATSGRRAPAKEVNFGKPKEVSHFVSAVVSAKEKVAEYREFHEEWKQCYGTPKASCRRTASHFEICENTPAALRATLENAVDELVKRDWVKTAEKLLKELRGAKYVDEIKHGNVFHFAGKDKRKAKDLLSLQKKLPKSHQYRNRDLKKIVARANAAIKGGKKIQRSIIANRGCPKGKKLKRRYKKLVMAHTDKKSAKIVRRTGSKRRYRAGLITKEAIPIVICSAYIEDGEKVCSKTPMSVYREKAPGGSWTSWAASVGNGREINCKKMK